MSAPRIGRAITGNDLSLDTWAYLQPSAHPDQQPDFDHIQFCVNLGRQRLFHYLPIAKCVQLSFAIHHFFGAKTGRRGLKMLTLLELTNHHPHVAKNNWSRKLNDPEGILLLTDGTFELDVPEVQAVLVPVRFNIERPWLGWLIVHPGERKRKFKEDMKLAQMDKRMARCVIMGIVQKLLLK